MLRQATESYRKFYEAAATDGTSSALFEHSARNLAEVLSYIIMGYLLLDDTLRDETYKSSCRYWAEQSLGWAQHNLAITDSRVQGCGR